MPPARRQPRSKALAIRGAACLALGALLSITSAWIPARLAWTDRLDAPVDIWDGPSTLLATLARGRACASVYYTFTVHIMLKGEDVMESRFADFRTQIAAAHAFPQWALPRTVRLDIDNDDLNMSEFARIDAFGWPSLCMTRMDYCNSTGQDRLCDAILPIANDYDPIDHALPTRIHWPGMLINTAIYAGALAAPWFALIAFKNARRRANGGCQSCGYSLVGLLPGSPCPECGETPRMPDPAPARA